MPGCFITRLLHAVGINKIKGAAINTNYEKIIQDYLSKFYDNLPPHPEMALSARREGNHFYFQAFGEKCRLKPGMISLSGKPAVGPKGLIISLYAKSRQTGIHFARAP